MNRRKSKSDNTDYRYEVVHSEEMQPSDIDTLAMCIASYIFQEMQGVAIESMQSILPDVNPLKSKKPVEVTDATPNRIEHSVDVKMDFTKIPEPRLVTNISFTVTYGSNTTKKTKGKRHE